MKIAKAKDKSIKINLGYAREKSENVESDCEIFEQDRVYNCQSVAQRLGQSTSTIREKVFYGQIPYFKAGEGRNAPVRFLGHTLNHWLERINQKKEEIHKKPKTTTKKKTNRGVKEFENFVENLERRN